MDNKNEFLSKSEMRRSNLQKEVKDMEETKHSGRYPFETGELGRRLAKRINNGWAVGIHVYSIVDEIIDFVVYVPTTRKDEAIAAIQRASERYCDEDDEGYYSNGYLDTVKEEMSLIKDCAGYKAFKIFTPEDFDDPDDYDGLPYVEAVEF